MKRLVSPYGVFALILLGSVIVNISLAVFIARANSNNPAESKDAATYTYLSKRIFAEKQNDILVHFVPLRAAISEYISKQKDEIGLYFEYLPSGTSIGINDRMAVRFASLIK